MPTTRTLAQLGNFINPDVPALPKPPAFERFVFEQPLLPAVALAVLGVVVLVALRNAGKGKAGLGVCAGLVVGAAGLLAAGAMVETDRERLLAAQDAVVAAVADADTGALETLLADDVRLRAPRLRLIRSGLGKPGILTTVRTTTGGAYPVRDFGIIERQGVLDGPNAARTQIHLRVESEAAGGTFAWFRLAWRRDAGGAWRVLEIEPLFLSGVMPYEG
jgi:hypothetical protein